MTSKHSGNELGREAGLLACRLVPYRTLAPFFGPGLLLGVPHADCASTAGFAKLTLVLHSRRSASRVANAYAVP